MVNFLKRLLCAPVSKQALTIMRAGAITIFLQTAFIIGNIYFCQQNSTLQLYLLYQNCIKYLFLEMVILVVGAFLFDLSVREMQGL